MLSLHYRFGDYELHPDSRELRRGGSSVSLPLKSFDCLVYLVERNQRAVGRDELISAVWGRADVSDALLGQTLARARRAVGDSGEAQSVIRTVAGFGYQWVAPVSTADSRAIASETPSTSEPAPGSDVLPPIAERPSPNVARRTVAASLVLLACLVAAVATFVLMRREPAVATNVSAATNSFLVLPVAVPENEPDTRWIRLGAMDFLASRLRERGGLPVLPADQTIAYLGARDDADLADPAERWRLAQAASATDVIAASARRNENGWSFELDVQDAEQTRRYAATAATPLEAADLAIGELLAARGVGASAIEPQLSSIVELRQRIDAAFLEGDLRHASALIEAAPLEAQQDPGVAVRAAEVDERAGRMELAEREFSRLADDARASSVVHGRALYGLCAIAYRRNDLEAAERHCGDALAVLADQREPMLLGRTYMLRAVIDDDLGRVDEAMAGFGLARLEWRRAGNLPGEASVDVNEGLADTRNGRLADAVAAFDRAAAVFARFGVEDHLASARAAKSDAQRMLLDHDGALASSADAWQLAAHVSDIRAVRAIGYSRALALVSAGRFDEAERLIERFHAGPETPPEFAVLHLEIAAERGRASEAADEADAMLDRVRRPPDPSSDARLSYATRVLVDAALRAKRLDAAEHILERLREAGLEPQDPDRAFVLDLASAEVAAAKHEDAAADRQYAAALDRAVRANRPDETVRAASSYVEFLLDLERIDEAKQVAGRLAVHADHDFLAACAMTRLHATLGDTKSAEETRRRAIALAGQRTP